MRGSWPLFFAILSWGQLSLSVLSHRLLNFNLRIIVDFLATIILTSPTRWFNSGETPELTYLIPDTLTPLSLPSTSRYLSFKKKYLCYFILRLLPLKKKYLCFLILRHLPLKKKSLCYYILRYIRDLINYIILKIYIGVVAVLPRRASNPGTRE
jgi:hypothetical protein